MTVSIRDKRYVRLDCGCKPSKLDHPNGTGLCRRHGWQFIDWEATNKLLTTARQRQERDRSHLQWQR